jgi:glycosyltransferase involved in cell wall biosynthesis
MRLTIGLPSYNNFTEIFFTIQSLRMHHNLSDCEIIVLDNFGDPELEKFINCNGGGIVRYEKCLEKRSPSYAKNKIFDLARGEMVLCMDSHILLRPGALDNIPITDDLIQGPLMYCDTKNFCCEWNPEWRGHMWGIWGDCVSELPSEPFEIWGMGMGLFIAKRTSWLRFNEKFVGFGAEEGYIHEKYRKAGRRVLCYPNIVWMHMFDRKIPYPVILEDRIKNYLIGFEELGLDPKPIHEHFGDALIQKALQSKQSSCVPVSNAKKISALCITYGRPHLLEEAIESFLRQDYENKELIIVNDLGEQTLVFSHPQIKIFNFPRRFHSIGIKRNKSVELSSGDILTNWDDDDISLPWRLSQIAAAFNQDPTLEYFKPDKAWCYHGDTLCLPHYNLFYMMAAFSKKAFLKVGGYKSINFGEDKDLCERVIACSNAKTISFKDSEYPFIYGWRGDSFHLSAFGEEKEMSNLKKSEDYIRRLPIEARVELKPHWRSDYLLITKSLLNDSNGAK